MFTVQSNGTDNTAEVSALFLNTNLECAQGLSSAIGLETVSWKNTTCPDGSNSNDVDDDDERTCMKNLVPDLDC